LFSPRKMEESIDAHKLAEMHVENSNSEVSNGFMVPTAKEEAIIIRKLDKRY